MTDGEILDEVVGLVGMKEAAAGITHLLFVSCWREPLSGATSGVASSQDWSNLGTGPDESGYCLTAMAGAMKWEMLVDVRVKIVNSVKGSKGSASSVVVTVWVSTISEVVEAVNMVPLMEVAEEGCSKR